MESQNCFNCSAIITEIDNFCSKCGNGLKCKICKAFIKKDATFCSQCGESLNSLKSMQNAPLNTIKYRKSTTEVSCEISFTDQVGKERMNDLLAAIVNNRSGVPDSSGDPSTKTLKIGSGSDVYGESQDLTAIEEKNPEPTSLNKVEIPHLNDIENKIDCSENVWIGVHAFYFSFQGVKNFNREEIRDAYMARRKTDSRISNFAAEWKKAHQKYFRTINDKELNFQTGMIDELKSIVIGNKKHPNTKTKKAFSTSGGKKTAAKSVPIEEFDLSKDQSSNKPSLEEFITLKKPGDSTYDRIVVIAYYITRINKSENFTEGQIEFAYKALQLSDRPGHLRQTINNIKNAKVWFKDIAQGQWCLERIGEIYVDEKLPPKDVIHYL